jgi:O-antigen ligase
VTIRPLAFAGPRAIPARLLVVGASLPLMTIVVVSDRLPDSLVPMLALGAVAIAAYRTLLSWQVMLAGLLLVILFIPIRRYTFPGNLPFQLEPYRLYVILLACVWFSSLLIDPRVRARLTGLEAPLALFLGAAVASVIVNSGRIHSLALGGDVAKKMTFFLSWALVFLVISSVVRRMDDVDRLIKVLLVGGAIVAFLAIIESRTGQNPFNRLGSIIPILVLEDTAGIDIRGGSVRAYASAQHPIALGAALAMLAPLGVYLARKYGPRWWLPTVLLVLGALATVSRTAILMLVVTVVVFGILRPAAVKRLWPAAVPLLLAVHFFLPGTVGTVKDLFFPQGGLVAQQQQAAPGSARISSLGPALDEWSKKPFLGVGYGTRIPEGPRRNSIIYDDEWLSTLVETGLVGALAWLWLFLRTGKRLGREAKRDPTDRGWLLTALMASVTSFALGMVLFDAFSFIQVTILLFVMLGIAASVLNMPRGTTATAAS